MARERLSLLPVHAGTAVHTLDLIPRTEAAPAEAEHAHLEVPAMSLAYRCAKRTLDIVVSATVLLVLSPLLAITSLAVILTSKGPALFRQQRVGEGGRIFTMHKFRSMYQDADHTLHQVAYAHFVAGRGGNGKVDREALALAGITLVLDAHADTDVDVDVDAALLDGMPRRISWLRARLHQLRPVLHAEDPRITPVGALLRFTSIDELPQLWNVLIGDMTLVGPRPPIPYEVRLYRPKHLQRLRVRPGVTGIWQVYGRNRVPFEKMVDMDIYYITKRTFWLDVKMLVLTLPAVLFTRGGK